MRLYTVGYSTATIHQLVGSLLESEVKTVVDVRSIPRSRLPQFSQTQLQRALQVARITYRYMGDRLGGMPKDESLKEAWRQGQLNSRILASIRASSEWNQGIAELCQMVVSVPNDFVCILCSEANPNECHRKAVALDVAKRRPQVEIIHLVLGNNARHEVGVQEAFM